LFKPLSAFFPACFRGRSVLEDMVFRTFFLFFLTGVAPRVSRHSFFFATSDHIPVAFFEGSFEGVFRHIPCMALFWRADSTAFFF